MQPHAGNTVHIGKINDLLALLGGGHAGDDHIHAIGLQGADQRGEAHGHDLELKAEHIGQFLDNVDIQTLVTGGIGFRNRLEEHEVGAQGNGQLLTSKGLGILSQRGTAAHHQDQRKNQRNRLFHLGNPPSFDGLIIIQNFMPVKGFFNIYANILQI